MSTIIIRRERVGDEDGIRAVHAAAFARPDDPGSEPVEAKLVDDLRETAEWLPDLSQVALVDDAIVGHVVCTRGWLGTERAPVLGLGPIGVLLERQGRGIGEALMHTVLGAADALDEPLVALLGDPGFYRRFGFVDARELGIDAPDPAWGEHFQVRPLSSYAPGLAGRFEYAAPFNDI